MKVPIMKNVLAANEVIAEELRTWFESTGIFVVNLLGSPGAGKTTLIEQTLERAGDRLRIGVIEGDIATSLDAERIARHGAPVIQINTGGACHLDAAMVRNALGQLEVSYLDILMIENVGNLICPAQFDLGESTKVAICSLPEGADKVLKYPAIFSAVSAVVLNKLDLLEHVDFNRINFKLSLAELNPSARLMELSCVTGDNLEEWLEWLNEGVYKAKQQYPRGGESRSPA